VYSKKFLFFSTRKFVEASGISPKMKQGEKYPQIGMSQAENEMVSFNRIILYRELG
jgi:hypothetical protein